MDFSKFAIYCADIGSVATNKFGWARELGPNGAVEMRKGGTEIELLASSVARDLDDGLPVALGFECPQYVPLATDARQVLSQRDGERGRPWSAGAGAAVLAIGLAETIWILREVRSRADGRHDAFLSWDPFVRAGRGLFLWEALVTGEAKGQTHVEDAEAAVRCFSLALPDLVTANALRPSLPVHSLIGAALLRTGWGSDLALLAEPCLVIRASKRGDLIH